MLTPIAAVGSFYGAVINGQRDDCAIDECGVPRAVVVVGDADQADAILGVGHIGSGGDVGADSVDTVGKAGGDGVGGCDFVERD